MEFVKSVIVGLVVSVVAYFFMFSIALIMVNVLPVIKYIAIGIGCAAMVYHMRKKESKEDDVQAAE